MANTVAKVRFVRCPKCSKLLPEFSDVPMYQCGGCGAFLRAKNCNISREEGESSGAHEKRESSGTVLSLSSKDGDKSIQTKITNSFNEEEEDRDKKSWNLSDIKSEILILNNRVHEGHQIDRKSMGSTGSESFYSVQSLIESENSSLFRRNSLSESQIGTTSAELIKLVEQLKDQVSCCNNHRSKARPCKRFYRPISGGAPFVVCYKCFEILYLPAGFFVSQRRMNKLKCGACSEILRLQFPASAHKENGNSFESPLLNSEEHGTKAVVTPGSPLHLLMGYPSARLLL